MTLVSLCARPLGRLALWSGVAPLWSSDWSFEDDMAFVLGGLGPVARERWDGLRLCDQMAVWRVLDTGRMEGEFQDVSEEREFLEQVVGVRPARADAV